jgi:hypothetical protein
VSFTFAFNFANCLDRFLFIEGLSSPLIISNASRASHPNVYWNVPKTAQITPPVVVGGKSIFILLFFIASPRLTISWPDCVTKVSTKLNPFKVEKTSAQIQ